MVPGWPRIVWQQKPLRVWHARGIHQCGQLHGVDQSEPEGMKTQKSSDDMKRGRQALNVNLGTSLNDGKICFFSMIGLPYLDKTIFTLRASPMEIICR